MKDTLTDSGIGLGGLTLTISLMDIVNGILSLLIAITTLVYLLYKMRLARHNWRNRK